MKWRPAALLALAAAAALACDAVYPVGPTETAVVLRDGRPVRLATLPGLHVKWPLVEGVERLDRRSETLAGRPWTIVTADGGRLDVEASLRYRLTDPIRFHRAVIATPGGPGRLAALADAGVASAFSGAPASEITAGPQARLDRALATARRLAARDRLGVEVQEVSLLRVTPADPEAAARRMQAGVVAEVAAVRAEAEAARRELYARADREAADVRGEGDRQALVVRGQGDAERTAILGAAYGADPGFARFFRRLEAYDQALDPRTTTLVLSPDNAFLHLFAQGPGGAQGR